MPVHDRRATRLRDGPCGLPARRERQRRRDVRRPLEADVSAQGGGVAKHIQSRTGCVLIEMEADAVLLIGSRHERMPGRHDMDLVTAGGDRRRDRLHERADTVPGEPRVRARHHHDDVAGHGALRKTRRHGVIRDSMSTELDTFDWP